MPFAMLISNSLNRLSKQRELELNGKKKVDHILKVILSCKTPEQINNAHKWAETVLKNHYGNSKQRFFNIHNPLIN